MVVAASAAVAAARRSGPPPPRHGNPAGAAPAVAPAKVQFGKPVQGLGHRIVLFGPGGIGKTTLASKAPGPVGFIDLDESLGRLGLLDVPTAQGITGWASLRAALQGDWGDIKTVVLDTGTRAEELAVAFTLENTLMDGNKHAVNVEGYGYGKGFGYVFDTFLPILSDMDKHTREGRNVIIICHDCTTTVPNPAGEDWLRYEPRLQAPSSGKASIRLRMREWADHVLFIGYDVEAKKKKGTGSGTRTIWPSELPHCMAKSRTCQDPIEVRDDNAEEVWAKIIK